MFVFWPWDEALPAASLDLFVDAGLMVATPSVGDPKLKFALDPISEYLAAWHAVIALRDGELATSALRQLLEELPPDRWPSGYLEALEQYLDREGLEVELPDRPKPELDERA